MLSIVTAADTYDLTTLATVKAELGIVDREEDEALASMIRQASGVIADHCNRVFALETVEETIRLNRRMHELVLERFPVTEIASVIENGVTLTEDDYEADLAAGTLRRLRNDTRDWWTSKIVVTYSAGYSLLDAVPMGIERACITLVRQYRFGADRDPMLRASGLDNVGNSSYFNVTALSPEVTGLLEPHRNRRLR
jgi:Phage gp6-like head-tail connector protein